MLVPVIGIVQVGAQGWADRYTYLPQIGIYLCLSWGLADISVRWLHRKVIIGMGCGLVLAILIWIARAQVSHWKDSESLWTHTLAVTPDNCVVENNLGEVLFKRGEIDAALSHYEKALDIRTQQETSRYDFLLALSHANIGTALYRKKRFDEAISHYQKAIEHQPDYGESYLGFGGALAEKGQDQDAIVVLQRAATLQPENAEIYARLGTVFLAQGKDEEAIAQYQKALELAPGSLAPLNNLAWLFATSPNPVIRNGPKAVELAERALQLSGGTDPFYLHKLAAAYAANENFPRALETAQRAVQLALAQGNFALASELRRNISVYQTNNPLTDVRRK